MGSAVLDTPDTGVMGLKIREIALRERGQIITNVTPRPYT
jgi:hypothetical protein